MSFMIKGNATTDLSRVERLRSAAEHAENLATLARVAEVSLERVAHDLHTLAAAARLLAAKLNCEADSVQVGAVLQGGAQ